MSEQDNGVDTLEEEKKATKSSKKAEVSKKEVNPLGRNDLGEQAFKFGLYDACAPCGTTREDLEDPAFWVHVGRDLREDDEIRVLSEDRSIYARCLVMVAMGNRIQVHVLEYKEIKPTKAANQADGKVFVAEVRGRLRWCVVQVATGELVEKKLGSEQEAINNIADRMKALNN